MALQRSAADCSPSFSCPRLEDVLKLTEDVYEVEEGSDYALKDSAPHKFSKSKLRQLYYPRYSTKTIHNLSIINENVINYPLLAVLLEKIATNEAEGAILVFMPGKLLYLTRLCITSFDCHSLLLTLNRPRNDGNYQSN